MYIIYRKTIKYAIFVFKKLNKLNKKKFNIKIYYALISIKKFIKNINKIEKKNLLKKKIYKFIKIYNNTLKKPKKIL